MKIRFGVIGTNWITDHFIEAAREHQDFVLKAVFSRTEESGTAFAKKHGIEHVYSDVEAMMQSGHIDAVYIASPNSFHARYAIAAMQNGVHVLCEKPVASNKAELEQMIETAKQNKVLLMEAMKSTLMPGFSAIAENIERIGTVRRYFASYCQYSSRYDAYKAGNIMNAFKPEFSNGALVDIGVYCIYPAVVLFGRPKSVKAVGYMLESGVDGEGSVLLEYENMDAVIMFSKITNSQLPSEIQGEEGSIIIERMNEPVQISLKLRSGLTEDLTKPTVDRTMYYEAAEFIQLLQKGKLQSDINTHEASLITMEIMDEARRQIGLRYAADDK